MRLSHTLFARISWGRGPNPPDRRSRPVGAKPRDGPAEPNDDYRALALTPRKGAPLFQQRADLGLDLSFFVGAKPGVNEADDPCPVHHEARGHRRRLIALRDHLTVVPSQRERGA